MTVKINIALTNDFGVPAGKVEFILEMPSETTRDQAVEKINNALASCGRIVSFEAKSI